MFLSIDNEVISGAERAFESHAAIYPVLRNSASGPDLWLPGLVSVGF